MFLKPMFENYKLMIVNLKPMFELKTHDWNLKTYVSRLIVHTTYIIIYKHRFES